MPLILVGMKGAGLPRCCLASERWTHLRATVNHSQIRVSIDSSVVFYWGGKKTPPALWASVWVTPHAIPLLLKCRACMQNRSKSAGPYLEAHLDVVGLHFCFSIKALHEACGANHLAGKEKEAKDRFKPQVTHGSLLSVSESLVVVCFLFYFHLTQAGQCSYWSRTRAVPGVYVTWHTHPSKNRKRFLDGVIFAPRFRYGASVKLNRGASIQASTQLLVSCGRFGARSTF